MQRWRAWRRGVIELGVLVSERRAYLYVASQISSASRPASDRPSLSQSRLSLVFLAGIFKIAKIRDVDYAFSKTGGDLERTAKCGDIAPQIAHIHVRASFELGHCRLAYLQCTCELLLRPLACLTQLGKRHPRLEGAYFRRRARLALGS